LQKRIEAAGQRCVNNVVDITNLVMLETGQPLHAYDRDRLGEGEGEGNPSGFSLRPAHKGEQLITLDGSERSFSEENLLVTHANKPIALAGVMGGEASAVHNGSRRLLLEAAVFEPAVVRRSARKAGLRSESSARFERGVASAQTMAAADRAVALLCELAGATVVGRWQAGSAQPAPEPLLLRRSALEKLLGPLDGGEAGYVELEDRQVESILERLGCQLERLEQEGEGWLVTVPASRCHDLLREVDLIEEVARLVGYDRFCSHLPDPLAPGGLSLEQALLRQLRAALRNCGMQELSHLSLVAQDADPEGQVALSNPLLADYGHLRTDLRQGLLEAATRNLQASQRGFWGFEIGRVFRQVEGEYEEEERLAGVFAGERCAELWSSSGQPQSLTYFQGRGYLTQALGSLGLTLQDRRAPADPMLHPGRSAQVLLEGRAIGIFAELHPALADSLELPSHPLIFDLAVAPLLAAAARDQRACPLFQPFATVPASERDLAFVVSEQQELATVLQELRKTGGSLLELVELLDRYTGAPIPAGYCSLAVRLRFRDPQATLRDEQVEPLMEKLRHCITAKFKAELRG
jgi:phenylalanyl-tRNA synthetase beta chain